MIDTFYFAQPKRLLEHVQLYMNPHPPLPFPSTVLNFALYLSIF